MSAPWTPSEALLEAIEGQCAEAARLVRADLERTERFARAYEALADLAEIEGRDSSGAADTAGVYWRAADDIRAQLACLDDPDSVSLAWEHHAAQERARALFWGQS